MKKKKIKDKRDGIKMRPKKALLTLSLIVLFCLASAIVAHFGYTLCVINNIFGIPCPACGMTRAHLALLRFDLTSALTFHPLFFFTLIIGAQIALNLFKPSLNLLRNKYINRLNLLLTIMLLVFYIARMVLFYPHTPPMVFNERSLLGLILNL
jgi:hypothetical protein